MALCKKLLLVCALIFLFLPISQNVFASEICDDTGFDDTLVCGKANSDEEGESDAVYDLMYVHEDGEESMYIKKSGEDTYQHYNGAVTSDFSSKEEAISNHIGSIQ